MKSGWEGRTYLSSASRCGTNNSAIFAEIVPEEKRTAVYAFDRSFEGAVAACAAPLVGKHLQFDSSTLISDRASAAFCFILTCISHLVLSSFH